MAALSELAARQRPIRRNARTSNTILAGADCGKWFDITSGTFSQTLTAAATLGASWWCWYTNSGTGTVTLDPNSSETIAGAATYALGPGQGGVLSSDGTNIQIIPFLNVPGITAAGLAILDDASAAAQRTTLGIGLTQIATGSLSGSAVTVTDIPATYKRLIIVVQGASASGDAGSMRFGYSVNNGSAYTVFGSTALNSGDSKDGLAEIVNYASTPAWLISRIATGGSSPSAEFDVITLADNIDAIRMDMSANNFDAGTYWVYGEA